VPMDEKVVVLLALMLLLLFAIDWKCNNIFWLVSFSICANTVNEDDS
jgi:hypothetical protein